MPKVLSKKPSTRLRRIGGMSQPLNLSVAGSPWGRPFCAFKISREESGVTRSASLSGSFGTSGTSGTCGREGSCGTVGTGGTGGTGGGTGFGGGGGCAATSAAAAASRAKKASTTPMAKRAWNGLSILRLCNMRRMLACAAWTKLGRK
jgi:hypothetical protein